MDPVPLVPGYHLVRPLGGGPLTAAWEAREQATDWPCVVKTLRADSAEPDAAIKLLQREARAGLRVRNRHVVRVTQAHVTSEPYFLVMDRVPGESLRCRLRREYRLEITPALWLARQLAQAVAALHREGFLHGDIKPENVVVSATGGVVLIDLGFARRPGENAVFHTAGYVLGTANYLAPELCGPQPRDGLAGDLFSLGVTLFEMLTGELPYRPGTLAQTLRRHECDPPLEITRLRELPAGVAQVVMRLLAHDPADRPKAGAVVQQLVQQEIASLGQRGAA
jgi:serine/threonine protein kinase